MLIGVTLTIPINLDNLSVFKPKNPDLNLTPIAGAKTSCEGDKHLSEEHERLLLEAKPRIPVA